MWGYGKSDLRYPNRRREVCSMLDDPCLVTQLNAAETEVRTGNFDAALESVTGHRGVGVAYMTKHLYFTGRHHGVDPYPIILDTKVSLALTGLSGYRFFVRPERDSTDQ